MKKLFLLFLAFSITYAPVLAWGEGGCPFSKNKANPEAKTEKVEASDSANK